MRKLGVLVVPCAGLLLAVMPADTQAQEKPESSSQAPPPAAAQAKPVTPPAAKPQAAAGTQPVDPNAGKTVEEIIERVDNEIIPLTEYEQAGQTADEDAMQEWQGRCNPEQLQANMQ